MAFAGGLAGALLARIVVNPDLLQAGAFIPVFGVNNRNVVMGIALSAVIGVLAGVIPATVASRLRIADALRRVA